MHTFFSISFLFMMNECLQKESEQARVYLLFFWQITSNRGLRYLRSNIGLISARAKPKTVVL